MISWQPSGDDFIARGTGWALLVRLPSLGQTDWRWQAVVVGYKDTYQQVAIDSGKAGTPVLAQTQAEAALRAWIAQIVRETQVEVPCRVDFQNGLDRIVQTHQASQPDETLAYRLWLNGIPCPESERVARKMESQGFSPTPIQSDTHEDDDVYGDGNGNDFGGGSGDGGGKGQIDWKSDGTPYPFPEEAQDAPCALE